MAVSLDLVLNLAETVIQMGQNSKQNKDRCQRVTKRVRALQELVIKLKEKDPAQISKLVSNALKELSVTLISAQNIMKKYKKSNAAKNFIKHSSYEEKFNKINDQLDDTFQVLSGALQIEHGDILNKVLDAVTEKSEMDGKQAGPPPIGFSAMPSPQQNMPAPSALPPPYPATYPNMAMPTPTITVTQPPNPMPNPCFLPTNPFATPTTYALAPPPAPAPTPCYMPPMAPFMAYQNTMPVYRTAAPTYVYSQTFTSRPVLTTVTVTPVVPPPTVTVHTYNIQ